MKLQATSVCKFVTISIKFSPDSTLNIIVFEMVHKTLEILKFHPYNVHIMHKLKQRDKEEQLKQPHMVKTKM